MYQRLSEKKKFSIISRIRSSNNAVRGIGIFLKSSHNAWGHLFFAGLAVYLGFILRISSIEWILIILTIGLVILAETINSAIEIDIDLTSPTYHPYARDTKDVAAGAVLLTVFISIIVGLIIFLPKILALMN
ncbi:MAG TPA: diacylglycerol kinase family protein [Candidatus Paceibacterota bacterium]|jgi:diacylglycerol kinase|nr:diacylglycerol kinase family protein [Candidatus Paceibacterota bacterium]